MKAKALKYIAKPLTLDPKITEDLKSVQKKKRLPSVKQSKMNMGAKIWEHTWIA